MLSVARLVASLAISLWGVAMLVIGLVNGVPLWILLGIAVAGVGLPFLGSLPTAGPRLYPKRGGIDPAAATGGR